jgi:microcystin-dependent protein
MGEIKLVSFNFAPKGWALCNGQFLPINQNQALFSLLGTMYGGNGQTTFALPNLQGRVPVHADGSSFVVGQAAGESSHTLTASELATHTHPVIATTGAGTTNIPTGNQFAGGGNLYAAVANPVALIPSAVSNLGGSQAHENRQPYLALTFCIALNGVFPSQN